MPRKTPLVNQQGCVQTARQCTNSWQVDVAEHVLRELAGGATVGQILEARTHLTREDVEAAVSYAADCVANEDILVAEDVS